MAESVTINAPRLLDDLRQLRSFGATGSGVVRPSLSDIDMQARHWLAQRMRDAGLKAEIDSVGNVLGRSANTGKRLLIGSHSDTQPTGGWLDGALGTIYAIEVVRALQENSGTSHLPVDAVALVDEESTFLSFLGSRALIGALPAPEIQGASNADGLSLQDAFAHAGLSGEPEPLIFDDYCGFLEAHIEQGPWLERQGKHIGVVESIVGSCNFVIQFKGLQNHAGTTPMNERKDAGRALLRFAHALEMGFSKACGERTVWTFGRVVFEPGAPSIVPGLASMTVQFRDPDQAVLDRFVDITQTLMHSAVEEGITVTMQDNDVRLQPPVILDDGLIAKLTAAAEQRAPGDWLAMPSAALHDAAVFASVMPAAMLFIPSINGISHDFAEDSHDADIALGCQVLAQAAANVLSTDS